MLSRYGYRFEEKDESDWYFSTVSSTERKTVFAKPLYVTFSGTMVIQVGQFHIAGEHGRYGTASAGTSNVYGFLVNRDNTLRPAVALWNSDGVSLRQNPSSA